jgi:adenylate cyclase
MIKVIQRGTNPVQNQYDYPELKIRIGIDFGKIGVFNMGWILMNWMGTQYL